MRLLLFGILLLSPAVQAEVYRYVDQNGGTVLSRQGVPLEAARSGYEVLSDQGRVIRVVPPPPTADDLRKRRDAEQQEKNDHRLRELYASVADLDAAREHKLRTLDAFVTVVTGNLQLTQNQISDLEQKAAQQERSGRKVDTAIISQIRYLQDEKRKMEGEVRRRQELRQKVNEEFAADRARLVQLYPNTAH